MPNVRLVGPQLTGSLQSNAIVKAVDLGGPGGAVGAARRILNRSILPPTVIVPVTPSDIANLNLGNGEYLAVSETVAQSLIGNDPGGFPATNRDDEQVVGSSGFPAVDVGNNSTNSDNIVANGSGSDSPNTGNDDVEVTPTIEAIVPEIAVDIVSSPGESTGTSPGDGVSALPPSVALDPVPEPAGLLLLSSGLAIGAQFLRRRKRLS
ncbi:MAG: hypothetical protein PVSMB1_15560 [Gemmatimonadaceae bacterium]